MINYAKTAGFNAIINPGKAGKKIKISFRIISQFKANIGNTVRIDQQGRLQTGCFFANNHIVAKFFISNDLISSKLMAQGVLFSSFCYLFFYTGYGRAGGCVVPAKIRSGVVLKYIHPKKMVLGYLLIAIFCFQLLAIFSPAYRDQQFPGFVAMQRRLIWLALGRV